MDPKFLVEQKDLPDDGSPAGSDGTAYLRRLKTNGADGYSPPQMMPMVAATPAPPVQERRSSRRYQCTGSIELRTEGGVRLWGTLRDISLHGCYVEMATTFPIGTQVNLALKAAEVWVRAGATVRTTYPSLGMGLCFGELAATQQSHLREILAASAERRAILAPQWRSS